jgi:uncharacterized repeat protein (TIGR01451 family)
MKIMQKVRSLSRKTKLLVAALGVGVAIAIPLAVNAEFTPNRPTFDYNKFNGNTNCADTTNIARDNGRCGSMTGPVFNSFVNTPPPAYGDERSFFDGKMSNEGNVAHDPVTNVTEGTQEVVLRTYIHNNANETLNCLPEHIGSDGKCTQIDANAPGIAKSVKVAINLSDAGTNAGTYGQVHRARSSISASNAATVTDSLDFTADKEFTMEYVPDSAVIYSGGAVNGKKLGTPGSSEIVNGGVAIGYDDLNGDLPGCFHYTATVEIHVKIKLKPVQQITKQVKKLDDKDGAWKESVDVKPGDRVQWLISTKNIGFAELNNVTVSDDLPPHLSYDPSKGDKVQLVDQYGTKDQPNNGLPLFDKNGFDFGTYTSGGARYIVFTTTAVGDFDGCQARVRNNAFIRSKQIPEQSKDSADVVITKENCNEVTPTYSCDALTKVQGDNRSTKFTVTASAAGGATITRYFFNFGDGSQDFVTDKNVAEHTYAKDGQYAVQSRVEVRLPSGELKTADGTQCATAVTFTTTPPTKPPVTPAGKTTTLPNTGPGDVVAVFVGVVTASTAAYYVVLRRYNV